MRPVMLLLFCLHFAPNPLHGQEADKRLYFKIHGGFSSYLGDNNTIAFNDDVFEVSNKWPYSAGLEAGYQPSTRWQFGLGTVFADYPIITRFSEDLPIENHPTRRTSFQMLSRYALTANKLQPFLVMGMHLTVGQVSIFEASKLAANRTPEIHKHYIWGPVLGAGVDLFVSPHLSLVAQLVTNVTLVDDAADGRLPLGPPLPTNLNNRDRFAPFDLLSGLSVGAVLRPGCSSDCDREGRLASNEQFQKSHGKIRLFRMPGSGLSTISYYFNPAEMKSLFVGITTGAGPKSITAQFIYPDDQVEHDVITFTDAFAGINLHYFSVRHENQRLTSHGGIMAAMPRQFQVSAGLDYHLNDSFSVGLEGRYALCPNREQTFYKNEVIHIMNSACEYNMGLGITAGFTL